MSKQEKKELRQQIVCEWLYNNYLQFDSLRHDVISDRLQVRALQVRGDKAKGERQETWRNLTDKDINTMVCNCVEDTQVNIAVNEMWTALKSDRVPSVNPIRTWLDSLRPYTPDQPDWIDLIAQQVRVKGDNNEERVGKNDNIDNLRGNQLPAALGDNNPSRSRDILISAEASNERFAYDSSGMLSPLSSKNNSTDRLWRACFKKWFVAMVASWMHDDVVNHTALVLVGRQGIFKTTWLDHLIPPELRPYSSKMPLSGQITKDDRLRLCENALLNIDELDAICGRELHIVKSLLTSTDVNERATYGRLKERRVRLASFCASTNNREFLSDITGNRRWLPFEVEEIQNPFHTTLPYEQMYAQAKAMVEQGIYAYWFDLEEIEQLEKHNEDFRAQDNEEQLLPILFDIPAEGKGEFMTTAEISDKLVTYGSIKKPMNTRQLGAILGKKGFTSKKVSISGASVRGWIVYKREPDEIKRIKQERTSGHPDNIY